MPVRAWIIMLLVMAGFLIAYLSTRDPLVLTWGCFVWALVYAIVTGPRRYL
jgi:hypothetical protein